MSLPSIILERSRSVAEGTVLSPKEFLHLGSRAAVDQAFSRLARDGQLSRVARGLYIRTANMGESASPSLEKVVKSMAVKGKAAIVLGGARAAEFFGLTSPQENSQEFLTSGRTQRLIVEGQEALLRHAPRWMFALGSSLAGTALRALAWSGAAKADETARQLRPRMPELEWETLSSIRCCLPSWMAIAIGRASTAQDSQ